MTTLADLRSQYPVFKDKGDFDIVRMLSDELQQPLDYTAYQLGLPPGDYVQNTGFGGDTATDLAVGASQIPGTVAGLADLANPFAYIPETNNLTLSKGVDWAEKGLGITDWRNRQQAMLSPERQAQDQAIRDKFAEGDYAGGAWEAVTSPRSVAGAAMQSVPLTLLGGALGRGVAAAADVAKLARLKKVAPWVGEGAVSTGAQVDQLTQQGVDPATANLAGLAAGAGVGAVGGSLGLAGRSVGIDDLEAWLGGAGRLSEGTKPVSLLPRVGGSAALETLQEVPQSAWEQATQNVATGDPLGKDVAYQSIMGGLSGAAMGGAFGVMPRGARPAPPPPPALTPEDTQAPPPPAPNLNQAAPTPPAAAAKPPTPVPGVSPDQLSDFERGLLGSLGANTGNPDFTALNPDGTVKGWVVDALRQASTNTPEQLKRKINSKSGIILKPLWQAAYDEKQKLKATPPKPTANTDTSETEQALIAKLPANKIRQGDGQPHQGALKLVQKIASMSSEELEAAKNTPMPLWHIPLYDHMIAIREAEQEQAKPESPAGPTSQEADLKTAQNPTPPVVADQELTPAPTPPISATQEPTPTPIEVPDAQAVPPTPQASQTPSSQEAPTPPAPPADLRPSQDAAQQAEMEARRARFEQRKLEAQAAADAQAATLETLATRKVVVDDSTPGWQDRLNAAIDKVATERGFDAKTRATFSEMVQRFYQVGRFNTYSGISAPPSYDAMAGRMTRDGYPVSHTTMGLLLNEFQQKYVDGLSAENITPKFENTKVEALGTPHDSGNYRGKKNVGATSASEDFVDLGTTRSEDVATVARDVNDPGDDRLDVSMPIDPNSGVDVTAEDTPDTTASVIETDNPDADLGYKLGAIGTAETAAQGGTGGGNVSSRPKVTAYFRSRYRFAANAERAKAGQAPITEQELTKELGRLDDIVLGRYFDRVIRSGVSDKRMVDPKDPKPKLLAAYQALQDDIKALGENAFRNTKNNRTVNDLPDPDVSIAIPGAISAWDKAFVGVPGAVHIGKLPAELASEWENVYNQTLALPDIHRAPALKKIARRLIDEYNARGSVRTSGQDTRPTSQPQGSEPVEAGRSPDNAGRLAESGNAQPGLAEERGQAAPPDIVVGDKSLAGVQVKSKPKRRVATPEVQQGQDKAEVANPTTKEQFEKAVSSVLSKGSNWRLHVYQNLDEALADTSLGNTPREIGNAYGWAKDIKGVKHAFFILDRIQQGTELGKFLHEVGAHLGIENILTKAELNNLYDKIKEWALQADTSLESQIAMAAMARVDAAQSEREKTGRESDQYTMDDVVRETLAYFVESAVTEFGVDPFALQATTALGSWFRRLWNGFKRALRKVRLTNLDTLEPQHLVDLAYGAARLELATHWHGTAAKFRQFNHAYMGSGEGAQAYGWGTYLAKRMGIGKGYMEAMTRRHTGHPIAFNGTPIEEDTPGVNATVLATLLSFPVATTTTLNKAIAWAANDIASQIDHDKAELVELKKESNGPDDYFYEDLIRMTEGDIARLIEAQKWLRDNKTKFSLSGNNSKGSLYRVDVNVQPDEVLHWDLPLSEQPKKVQDSLKAHMKGGKLVVDGTTGGVLSGPMSRQEGIKEALGFIRSAIRDGDSVKKAVQDVIDSMDDSTYKAKYGAKTSGMWYRSIRNWLNENKNDPFAEKPVAVEIFDTDRGQEILARIVGAFHGFTSTNPDSINARDLGSENGKKASMFLDSIGIKGIEHWDRPSRTKMLEWERHNDPSTWDDIGLRDKFGAFVEINNPRAREVIFVAGGIPQAIADLQEEIDTLRKHGLLATIQKDIRLLNTLTDYEKKGYFWGDLPERLRPKRPANLSTNLVVFNDKNIYRVANAVGGDTSPGKVQYGFNAPEHLTAIQSAVTDQIKDTYSHATKRGILGWMSVDQLADRFGKDLPMVKTIAKTLGEMSAQSKHWLDRADHTVRMWSLLTPKQKEVMHNIMSQATLNGYDPEDATTVATKPMEKQLDQWWNQLKALDATAKVKAVPVYLAARKHFQDDLVEADAYLTKLQASATGKQATSINHLVAAIRTLSKNRKGVYFPLLRLGEFYSVGMSQKLYALHEKKLAEEDAGRSLNPADQVLYDKMRKDPKAYVVQGHESEARAARAVRKYEAQGMVAASNIMRFVSSKARAAITPEMEKFQKILADLGVQGDIASNLEQSYEHLLISNLPEGHALKQQLHREGIYGWNEDMMRSFAKATQARAFALSRLLHVRDLQEQMGELDAYSAFGRNPPDKAQMARDVLNELKRQQDLAYTRTSDPVFVRFATGWNYYAMLGASPAFWLLNLSQVPVITLPWLAARNQNRYGATIKALATGAKQIYKMVSISFENGELRSELDPTKNVPGITADEHRMLQDLKERGKLEFTIGMDIGAIAEGEYGAISKLKRSLNTPTNVTELINRGSTALAAYRISRKNGHTHDQAVEFADEAVGKTHMNYDPANTARNLKTIMGIPGTQAFAKIAFQFWKFQQGMAYLTLSTMKDAFNHPDPAVRKTARDTAIGMTLTLSATAGAFGLPFMGWGLGLLTQLFKAGPDDRDPDAERMLKNWLHDYMPWVENYLTKGVWGLLPQGINPDFSSRFSTANLMNPLAYARYDSTDRGEDVVKETLFRTFGGATATSAGAVYDGIKALLDGDMLKATEKLVPLKFLKDMARAAALGTKGLQTGTGEQRLDPGDFTATDEIWQLMGVTPMKKSLYYDRTKAIQGAMQPVNDVRTKLLSEYGQTRAQGGDVSKAVQEITKFNIRNPQARITTENMKQAYQRRQKNQQSTDSFGVLLDKRTSPYAQNARWAG